MLPVKWIASDFIKIVFLLSPNFYFLNKCTLAPSWWIPGFLKLLLFMHCYVCNVYLCVFAPEDVDDQWCGILWLFLLFSCFIMTLDMDKWIGVAYITYNVKNACKED